MEYPTKIIEIGERVTRNKVIKMCKVQWSHHSEDETTFSGVITQKMGTRE
jgi:hypothetical protein